LDVGQLLNVRNSPQTVFDDCDFENQVTALGTVYSLRFRPNSHYSKVINCRWNGVVATAISRGIYIENSSDTGNYSLGVSILTSRFKNIQPTNDGDAIVWDQAGFDSQGLVDNCEFEDCYKRFVKVTTNGVEINNCRGTVAHSTLTYQFSAFSLYGSNNSVRSCRAKATGNATLLYAVDISAGDGNEIVECRFENSATGTNYNSSRGVRVEAGVTGTTVHGCRFKNFQTPIFVVSSTTDLFLEQNKFLGTMTGNIITASTINGLVAEGNIAAANSGYFIGPMTHTNLAARGNVTAAILGFAATGISDGSTRQPTTLFSGNINSGNPVPDLDGGKLTMRAAAAPGSGDYAVGDSVYYTTPAAGGRIGLVCTTAGTPGTWKEFGAIDA
jgi:hypothetical protein